MLQEKLSVNNTYNIVIRGCELLESLFLMWVIDDEIGKEVGINGDGFDYLLEKMG